MAWRQLPAPSHDGTLTPDFRGALETDDSATILFAWNGYGRRGANGTSQLVGGMTHISDDERYRWLNDAFCAVAGEVQHRREDDGIEVVLEVFELVWEPLAD